MGLQKNMLQAWNFNKYKIRHRPFDNNFQKKCRVNILQSDTAQILLIIFLMAGLFLDN